MSTVRVACLISGGGSNMIALARTMNGKHPGRMQLVLSNNPDASGLSKARGMGIQSVVCDHRRFGENRAAYEVGIQGLLRNHRIDLVCLAGFMRVLTPVFMESWRGRILNIHPSLLPKYKGLHTHQRALDAGDDEHGCTVHQATARLDDGPILGRKSLKILPGETAEKLAARVLKLEHELYPATVRKFLEYRANAASQ
jgi:phosphoribosylglycinamide formyltransferase-1